MKKQTFLLATSLLVFMSSCVVGPNYRPPENIIPEEWASIEAVPVSPANDDRPLIEWWRAFEDPFIDRYISKAAAFNYNIQVAAARVVEARAIRKATAAALFPQITAKQDDSHIVQSLNGYLSLIPPPITIPRAQNLYIALFDASWEIDIFGKNIRKVEAANALLGSAIENRNDVLLTVLAETAATYVEVRSSQEQIRLTDGLIKVLENNAELVRKRLQKGVSNKLDLDRIEAELAIAISGRPKNQSNLYAAIYRLSVLTGELPEALLSELLEPHPLPYTPKNISLGIRSDLLRRRPDVRKAERDLAASSAEIGAEIAAAFPSFSLTGNWGVESLRLSNLFTLPSKTWTYGSHLVVPLFEGGRLVANIQASEAVFEAQTANYRQVVLKALEEAETYLMAFTQDLETVLYLDKSLQNNRNLTYLTQKRYERGTVNLLELLDSERQLIAAEQILLNNRTAALLDLIALYKSLGGGWECF